MHVPIILGCAFINLYIYATEQAQKERSEKELVKIKKAKEALAVERAEITRTREQLAKQGVRTTDWIRDHPEAAKMVVNDPGHESFRCCLLRIVIVSRSAL